MRFVMKNYPGEQLQLVRVLLGGYLLFLFCSFVPYATELFSNQGVVPNTFAEIIVSPFIPFSIYEISSPLVVQIGLGALIVLAGLFMLGWQQRTSSLLLWLGWVWLSYLNPFSSDPAQAYIGLLLLVFIITPSGTQNQSNQMSSILYWGCWVILGLSFSISGYEKFTDQMWTDGLAVYNFCTEYAHVEGFITDACASFPAIPKFITLVSLYSQLLALPLILIPYARTVWWYITFISFAGALFVIDALPVLLGILLFLCFVMEQKQFSYVTKKMNCAQKSVVILYQKIKNNLF